MKLLIIIPAYNEARVILKVLTDLNRELKELKIASEVAVIDDGSSDNTVEIAKKATKTVLRHPINRGLGGALATGFEYARRNVFDIVVTFDADGQHNPKDIHNILKPIISKKADVVIGSRTLGEKGKIPFDRKVIIWSSNLLTTILFAINTTDSQSGLRAFSKDAIKRIKIKTQGMEVSTEIFSEIKRNHLKLAEVPVSVKYTKYSRSKGQSNLNALSIIVRLLLRISR